MGRLAKTLFESAKGTNVLVFIIVWFRLFDVGNGNFVVPLNFF